MDYTLSDHYVIHPGTGNRMHEDNAAVTTAVSDKDMNDVIWSLMEIVKAAGLAGAQFDEAVPATYQKLLTALRSTGVFTTAAQFDNSTKAATTAFVQRALGNKQDLMLVSAPTTLTPADLGKLIVVTAAVAVTLPPVAACPPGTGVELMSTIAGASVVRAGADTITAGSTGAITTLPLNAGDSANLTSNTALWYLDNGTALIPYMASFAKSHSANGYQKFPNNLIHAWGTVGVVPGGTGFTFPIAFPNNVFGFYPSVVDAPTVSQFIAFQNLTLTGASLATNSATKTAYWFAIGN
ncbi:MAG: gp53-like domain-containing protein [Burkholderiales bacterium]